MKTMTKNTFFSIVASLLLLVTNTIAQNKKSLYSFPIGVQTYSYRNSFPLNIPATLDTIKAAGITELEANAPNGISTSDFRKLCDERNFKIISTGGDYNQLVKDPSGIIKDAKILGASYVMCAWIPHKTRGGFTFEEAKKAVDDFNIIGKKLANEGLTFCYHIHGYEFQPYQNGTLFDYIVQNTDSKYVSYELDVLWAHHGGGNPLKLLQKYGKRFKLLHLKDLKKGIKGDLTGGTALENDVILGTGQIDLKSIIKKSKSLGIKHYFIEDESPSVVYQVPRSIAYLKSL
jgi:sugar phosphate isomerase/epimerase